MIRRLRPTAGTAYQSDAPSVWWCVLTMPLVPEAVRQTRRDTAMALTGRAVPPDSVFGGTVLLVVSELVTNAVRHAARRSPTADVTLAVGEGELAVGVADRDPRLPDLSPGAPGAGLRTVAGLVAGYGGSLTVERPARGPGKVVVARFRLPEGMGPYGGRCTGGDGP
ncbi:ATP-binding protein [Streptomyces mobaraensis]|nr:ATP-binding protein [Streptomyces mobaraensis]